LFIKNIHFAAACTQLPKSAMSLTPN